MGFSDDRIILLVVGERQRSRAAMAVPTRESVEVAVLSGLADAPEAIANSWDAAAKGGFEHEL